MAVGFFKCSENWSCRVFSGSSDIMDKERGEGLMNITEKLAKYRAKYQPLAFWSWNAKLDVEELRKQIRWMKEEGMGGFFMHARSGLQTEYLSDEWMNCIRACAEEAESLGMEAWLYDENGWPSGFVGGKLLEKETNRDQYIDSVFGTLDEKADVSYRLDQDRLIRMREGENYQGECLNLYIRYSDSTVDILNPEVTEQFITETHQKYQELFGEQFSQKIRGFFTDEPQYYRWKTPYTPMIAELFEKEYHEDILDELGLLFVEKENYRSFRYRYWRGMQKLMLTHFAKKIYDWCEERQVRFTGHFIEERALGFQIMCCGGVMPFYEYEHIPGIDWLNRVTDNELPPRQVASVACQMGRKQVITETFAGCGWHATPTQLRRIAGFQFANGVNMVCHHLVPYSERGQRKRDYPTHFTRLNPWVKENFCKFNDYLTNLGCILGEAQEPVNVAVLHPIRSAYFDYKREDPQKYIMELEQSLSRTLRILSSRGIAYHFLDETLLEEHGFVDGTRIGCGRCSYDYLVLPKMYTMGKETGRLLAKYVANGGKVLLLEDVPQYLEGELYDYAYLRTNCTLEEIMEAQPYHVKNFDTELYYTYRILDGKPLLFVQNASAEKKYIQEFSFADGSCSFTSLDPVSLKKKKLPCTVSLQPEESLLLLPEICEIGNEEKVTKKEFKFTKAKIDFAENYMTIDQVSCSKDGKTYTKPILVYELFQQLLSERYEGSLWLRFSFKVQTLPESISLISEYKTARKQWINGQELTFENRWEEDADFRMADIAKLVKVGTNHYEVQLDWFQSEKTYYALFGENVTESLKNCIVYDSELEAVYICGRFGVYSNSGFVPCGDKWEYAEDFYIGDVPETVTEPVTEGLPFFRGTFRIHQDMWLDSERVVLQLPGNYLFAKVWVNGQQAGEAFFEREIDISPYICKGNNKVIVEYTIGNQNFFGPLHLEDTNRFIGPGSFEEYTYPRKQGEPYIYKFQRFWW